MNFHTLPDSFKCLKLFINEIHVVVTVVEANFRAYDITEIKQ